MGYAVILLLIRKLIIRIVDNSSTGLSDGPMGGVKKWQTSKTNTETILVSNQALHSKGAWGSGGTPPCFLRFGTR